jgi:uncharacterized protein YjeT (DUF2065 family)
VRRVERCALALDNNQRRAMKFFICVIGMVMIIEGLPYFAFPEKMKSWFLKLLEVPVKNLRKFGFVIMLIGLGLVYIGKR